MQPSDGFVVQSACALAAESGRVCVCVCVCVCVRIHGARHDLSGCDCALASLLTRMASVGIAFTGSSDIRSIVAMRYGCVSDKFLVLW